MDETNYSCLFPAAMTRCAVRSVKSVRVTDLFVVSNFIDKPQTRTQRSAGDAITIEDEIQRKRSIDGFEVDARV
jgi:hypothetical protein